MLRLDNGRVFLEERDFGNHQHIRRIPPAKTPVVRTMTFYLDWYYLFFRTGGNWHLKIYDPQKEEIFVKTTGMPTIEISYGRIHPNYNWELLQSIHVEGWYKFILEDDVLQMRKFVGTSGYQLTNILKESK